MKRKVYLFLADYGSLVYMDSDILKNSQDYKLLGEAEVEFPSLTEESIQAAKEAFKSESKVTRIEELKKQLKALEDDVVTLEESE